MMKIKWSSLIIIILFSTKCFPQSDELYKKALQLNHETRYKESFVIFQQLLKSDSNNVDYLHQTSFLFTKLGFSNSTDAEKMSSYRQGEYLAKKAIALNNNSAGAHYSYAIALGRINENAGNKQKIANAKLIKSECDLAIKLDPELAGAYHNTRAMA